MVLRFILFSLLGVSLLAGCATTGDPTFMPLPGTRVVVTQELSTQQGSARLWIQNGSVRARRDITVQEPHCQFFSTRSRAEMRNPLVIQPQTFTVTRSFQQRDYTWAAGLKVAGFRTNRNLSTIMEIEALTQPDITELICSRWDSPRLANAVTIAEMQDTLGQLVRLELPPSTSG